MKVVNLSKDDENHSHEIKKINLLSGSWLNPASFWKVLDNLSNIVVVNVAVRNRISHFCVNNLVVDFIPAIIEVLESF